MKYSEAIRRADERCPNAFSDAEKRAWLAALDGQIAADVMLMDVSEVRQFSAEGQGERETLVRFPHDEMYISYLLAKIDEGNGEYERYQNSAQIYNRQYRSFVRWFAQTYAPANGYRRGQHGDV